MVEHGVVKKYFGSRSLNQGRYGFIQVLDKNQQPTGEEVYFHFNQARRPQITRGACGKAEVTFSDVRAGVGYFDREIRNGDRIVFVAHEGNPRRKVAAWVVESVWDAFVDEVDEAFWSDMDKLDTHDFVMCTGQCGRLARECTCTELAIQEGHGNDFPWRQLDI